MPNTKKKKLFVLCWLYFICLLGITPTGFAQETPLDSMKEKARTQYQQGRIEESFQLFDQLLTRFPNQPGLAMEYVYLLIQEKRLPQAANVLHQIITSDPDHPEALLYMGYIHYWEAEYDQAKRFFQKLLAVHPDHSEATNMILHINEVRGLEIMSHHQFDTENQPLSRLSNSIRLEQFNHVFFHPKISLSYTKLWSRQEFEHLPTLLAGNTFHFTRLGLDLSMKGGFTAIDFSGSIEAIGQTMLSKQIDSDWYVSLRGEAAPEFATLASLDERVRYNEYKLMLEKTDKQRFTGQTAWTQRFYENGTNVVNTFYIWGLSPAIPTGNITWHIGYGFNYTDSKENRFSNTETIAKIIMDFDPEAEIPGQYIPYFTPDNQQIHSLLVNMDMRWSEKTRFTLQTNFGLYAAADIPYLYLDEKNNNLFINRDFSRERKTNYDIKASLHRNTDKNNQFILIYRFFRNFFFDQHSLSFTWKGLFTNDR